MKVNESPRPRREAAVGLGGASFLAPLDLPLLFPRASKRSPADACAPFGFALRANLPSETLRVSAVHFRTRAATCERRPFKAHQSRCRAGRVRLCPLPTFSGRFRYTGRVAAAKPPKEKRGSFGANEFARNLPRFSYPRQMS